MVMIGKVGVGGERVFFLSDRLHVILGLRMSFEYSAYFYTK